MIAKTLRQWFRCCAEGMVDMMNLTNAEIQASILLEESGLLGNYPIRIIDLVKALGYELVFFNADDVQSKQISGAVNKENQKIYVNNADSAKRQAFTIAHEIGHIKLHDDNFIDYRTTHPNNDSRELEADDFAANLLMPRDDFIKQYNRIENIAVLSDFFFVSMPAVRLRIAKLGLN